MVWTEPLHMEEILVTIFSGTPEIFIAVALFLISGMSAYFRMNGIGMFFMMGIFLLMFSGFVSSYLMVLLSIIGGLFVGYLIQRIFS